MSLGENDGESGKADGGEPGIAVPDALDKTNRDYPVEDHREEAHKRQALSERYAVRSDEHGPNGEDDRAESTNAEHSVYECRNHQVGLQNHRLNQNSRGASLAE
jgi:hypothetical protein